MTFTFDQLLILLRSIGKSELAALFDKWRGWVEPQLGPLLPKIGARALEKGLWKPDVAFTPAEERAIPYLRQMNAALEKGGSEEAMRVWRELVSRPDSREALAGIAA